MARRSTASSRTLSHWPNVGEPTRMSMAKSMNDPDSAVTYLACEGGTSAKCTPRTVPLEDTETLVWMMSRRCPTASASRSPRKDSRNTPRSSALGGPSAQGPALGKHGVHVGPVAALDQRVGQVAELRVGQPPVAPGDLLDTPDLVPLPGLHDRDELAGLQKALERAGVEPGRAAWQDGDVQVAALQVVLVDPGDLELAAVAGRQVRGDLDDVVVVEVEPGDRIARLGLGRLLLDGEHRAVLVELHHVVGARLRDVVGEHVAALELSLPAQ